jgi:hypothetical protein
MTVAAECVKDSLAEVPLAPDPYRAPTVAISGRCADRETAAPARNCTSAVPRWP